MGKDTSIPRFNLSLCLLARGRHEEALAEFASLDRVWARAGRRDMAAYAGCGMLCAASHLGEGTRADALLVSIREALAEGAVDIDLAQLSRDAARAWAARGDSVRARACGLIALAQRRALGDEAEAQAISDLAGVGDPA
jgi:hypothetical protein